MNFPKRRPDFLKISKIAVGCCLAVFLAELIGLRTPTSAGIITLLSIQNTKRETLSVAGRRLLAFSTAVPLAWLIFSGLGFHVLSFGVFLFLFTFLCYAVGLESGVSMSTVLVTHFWGAGTVSLPLILNELLLLCIGMGVGVLVNLYMPRSLAAIKRDQAEIDGDMQKVIRDMAAILAGGQGEKPAFQSLRKKTEKALERAYDNMNNTLATDMRYYVQYLDMRRSQCALLERIYGSVARLRFLPAQAQVVADFMEDIANSFHEYNNATALQERWTALRQGFKAGPLPITREEFESRAILFQIAQDLDYLLLAKHTFAVSLSDWQIRTFWEQDRKRTAEEP